jgi:hypothetical protein
MALRKRRLAHDARAGEKRTFLGPGFRVKVSFARGDLTQSLGQEEIKAARAGIERETMADANAILERLRSTETLKLATVAHRMNEAVTELEAVDR